MIANYWRFNLTKSQTYKYNIQIIYLMISLYKRHVKINSGYRVSKEKFAQSRLTLNNFFYIIYIKIYKVYVFFKTKGGI